jgi:hypothetical protein
MYTAMDRTEIIALGASLRQIDQNLLKRCSNIQRIWYQGEEAYFDVFFELQNSELVWFQFTLRGKALFWDKQHSIVQTGLTNEFGTDNISYYPGSKLIKTDRKPDLEFVKLVKEILQTKAREPFFDRVLAILAEL